MKLLEKKLGIWVLSPKFCLLSPNSLNKGLKSPNKGISSDGMARIFLILFKNQLINLTNPLPATTQTHSSIGALLKS